MSEAFARSEKILPFPESQWIIKAKNCNKMKDLISFQISIAWDEFNNAQFAIIYKVDIIESSYVSYMDGILYHNIKNMKRKIFVRPIWVKVIRTLIFTRIKARWFDYYGDLTSKSLIWFKLTSKCTIRFKICNCCYSRVETQF